MQLCIADVGCFDIEEPERINAYERIVNDKHLLTAIETALNRITVNSITIMEDPDSCDPPSLYIKFKFPFSGYYPFIEDYVILDITNDIPMYIE